MATRRQTALRIVNPLLGLLMVNQALTGGFHLYLSSRAFTMLHEWSGMVMVGMSMVHVVLNWGWVRAQLSLLRPSRSATS